MSFAIVAAMTDELVPFITTLKPYRAEKGYDNRAQQLYTGTIEGRPVVAAKMGLGKVNAAMTVQKVIDTFDIEAVLLVGLAGALDPALGIGDIIIGDRFIQHDMDLTVLPCGLKHGEIVFDLALDNGNMRIDSDMRISRFDCNVSLVRLVETAARKTISAIRENGDETSSVVKGTIVSGDQFISSNVKQQWLRDTFQAAATEMEGGAIAQVCHMNGVPFTGIRVISDKADHSAAMDIGTFLPKAADRYYHIVLETIRQFYR